MTGDIVIVDMQISNLASVLQALQQIGAPSHVFATPENIRSAGAILLPGVGAFGDGMASLRQKELVDPIRQAAESRHASVRNLSRHATSGAPQRGIWFARRIGSTGGARHAPSTE